MFVLNSLKAGILTMISNSCLEIRGHWRVLQKSNLNNIFSGSKIDLVAPVSISNFNLELPLCI